MLTSVISDLWGNRRLIFVFTDFACYLNYCLYFLQRLSFQNSVKIVWHALIGKVLYRNSSCFQSCFCTAIGEQGGGEELPVVHPPLSSPWPHTAPHRRTSKATWSYSMSSHFPTKTANHPNLLTNMASFFSSSPFFLTKFLSHASGLPVSSVLIFYWTFISLTPIIYHPTGEVSSQNWLGLSVLERCVAFQKATLSSCVHQRALQTAHSPTQWALIVTSCL
jgi:hypothetical protein